MANRSRILVVDDNETVLRVVSAALEKAGYDVATRSEPIGTTVAMMRVQPELVLLDVNMPALEGNVLVESIRKRELLRDVIVLLYSAIPAAELAQLARACHADGFIPKSASTDAVVDEVTRCLARRRAVRPHALPASAGA
ncbi:MAG: response regulator [Myxococcota bacterium]